jgi:hypothetical protein
VSAVPAVEGPWDGGEGRNLYLARISSAGHVGVAGRVHGDADASVSIDAAEVGGVGERRARRIELRDEGI